MAFLKGRLAATEGGFFKREQEDELKEYRRRRIRDGAIKTSDAYLEGRAAAEEAFGASSEKLAEIYAQETRLSAPEEVLRRRVNGQMPPGEGAGRYTARGSGFLTTNSPHMPRTSLGRNRWSLPVAEAVPLLPEENAALAAKRILAQKTLAAGTRALLYGTALAVVGLVAATHYSARALNIYSEEDLRERAAEVSATWQGQCVRMHCAMARLSCATLTSLPIHQYIKPHVASLKANAQPHSEWLSARVARWKGGDEASRGGDGGLEFARELRRSSAFRGLQSPQHTQSSVDRLL